MMRIGLVLVFKKGFVASRFTLPCPNLNAFWKFSEHERVPRVLLNLCMSFPMCRHGGANNWL